MINSRIPSLELERCIDVRFVSWVLVDLEDLGFTRRSLIREDLSKGS